MLFLGDTKYEVSTSAFEHGLQCSNSNIGSRNSSRVALHPKKETIDNQGRGGERKECVGYYKGQGAQASAIK